MVTNAGQLLSFHQQPPLMRIEKKVCPTDFFFSIKLIVFNKIKMFNSVYHAFYFENT